jgi:stage III sporulation protein AG
MGKIKNMAAVWIENFKKAKNDSLRKWICVFLVGVCMLIILWPVDSSGKNKNTTDNAEDSTSGNQQSDNTSGSGVSQNGDEGADTVEENIYTYAQYIDKLEERLENILSNVKNVGSVNVMITLKDNGEKVVEKDYEKSESTNGDNSQASYNEETVVSKSSNDSTPYVKKILEPEIEGVLVSCEGGNNPETVVQITEAVQALFDVPAHKIVVLELQP